MIPHDAENPESEAGFTVVLATRNRPVLLQRSLASVLAQQVDRLDVLVIDDGTEEPFAEALAAIEAAREPRVRFMHLERSANGHGQSYVLNTGAAHARERYLCFLDDDDEWTDPQYLACAAGMIREADAEPDLLLFDQAAFVDGRRVERTIWIEDLPSVLPPALRPPPGKPWRLDAAQLLRAHGFCHLNTTIIRRDFFAEIDGLDNELRYECDRDFYLRAIDRARLILYMPRTVSRHNVPNPTRQDNMSTLVSDIQKRTFQVTLLQRAAQSAQQAAVRDHARQHLAYARKRLALALYRAGRSQEARRAALAALQAGFTLKWLAFCAWVALRSVFSRPEPATAPSPPSPP